MFCVLFDKIKSCGLGTEALRMEETTPKQQQEDTIE